MRFVFIILSIIIFMSAIPVSVYAADDASYSYDSYENSRTEGVKKSSSNFVRRALSFIYFVISKVLELYMLIWFIWIIISWLQAFGIMNLDYYHPLVELVYNITDGVVYRVFGERRLIIGMMDLTPMLFLLILYFLKNPLLPFLFDLIAIGMTGTGLFYR